MMPPDALPSTEAATQPAQHGFPPVWQADARILLLGSFPGTASLKAHAYYAHPRNQFWPILGALLGTPLPEMPYAERLDALKHHRIALWDTVGHCRRQGSLDSQIRDATLNAFQPLLAQLPELQLIGFNGQRAAREQTIFRALGYQTAVLPSTSPAHASLRFAQKLAQWQAALGPWLC
ncbi:MAG: DNA-deoxyinosine glycosylase [Lautropia sp.]|nr:DNA-deoxyinosine glycosylase [Lautropia sp.]